MKFEVKNLNKAYKEKVVVKKFSYTFESGLYLFEGQNGSGKSTTLKMIAGVLKPSNLDYKIEEIAKCYLPEKPVLTNGKVQEFLNQIKKLYNKEIDVRKLLATWKIPDKKMSALSKGNKQKVAILMTYLTKAKLYLFDEPTDSLDQESIILFTDYIKSLVKKEKIVIIVTHEEGYFKDIPREVIIFGEKITED